MKVARTRFDEILVLSYTFFNPILCLAYGWGVHITSNAVVFFQVSLFLTLLFVVVYRKRYLIEDIVFLLLSTALISFSLLFHQDTELKYFFSILIVPLSLLYSKVFNGDVWKIIKIVFFVSFVALILEVFFPRFLLKYFPVGEYLAATRDWIGSQERASEVDFYVGSLRPGGSYFWDGLHRVGSIFLEPLTYSYFCLLVIVASRVFEDNFIKKLGYISVSFIAILLTDSRLALGLGVLFLLIPVKKFPVYIPISCLIMPIFFVFYMVAYSGFFSGELPLRISYTFVGLFSNDLASLFGFLDFHGKFNDSGYLIYIAGLGLFGFLIYLLWLERISFNFHVAKISEFRHFFWLLYLITLFFGGAILSAKVILLWIVFSAVSKTRHIN